MENKRFIKAAENLDTIAKIGTGCVRAASIVCGIFVILVLIFGEKVYALNSLSLDLDFIKIHMADEYLTTAAPLRFHAAIGLAAVAILCEMGHTILKLIRDILAPMKENRPFESNIPHDLRKIAWIVLIGGAVLQIAGIVERLILTRAFPMDEIFSSAAIAGYEYSFTIDFNFVLIFCVIMFLSYIFSYGQKLQQESDETL